MSSKTKSPPASTPNLPATQDQAKQAGDGQRTALALLPPTTIVAAVAVSEAESAFLAESQDKRPEPPSKVPVIEIDHKAGQFVMPDGQVVDGVADGICGFIINHFTMRAYYATGYDPRAQPEPPVCHSKNCVVPDSDVVKPQNADCGTCPKNQFGSAGEIRKGAKGKACREKLYLFVVNPEFGNMPLAALILPPTGLSAWYGGQMVLGGRRGYLDQLKGRHAVWQTVWSRIRLSRESDDDVHCAVEFEMGPQASTEVSRQLGQINLAWAKPIKDMRDGKQPPPAEKAAAPAAREPGMEG